MKLNPATCRRFVQILYQICTGVTARLVFSMFVAVAAVVHIFAVVIIIAIDNVYTWFEPFHCCITFPYFIYNAFLPFHPVLVAASCRNLCFVIRYCVAVVVVVVVVIVIANCVYVCLCRHSPEIYENFNFQY